MMLLCGSYLGNVIGGRGTNYAIARYKRGRLKADTIVVQLTRSDGAIYLVDIHDTYRTRLPLHSPDTYLKSRRLMLFPHNATEEVDLTHLLLRPSFEEFYLLSRITIRSGWTEAVVKLVPNEPLQPAKSMEVLKQRISSKDQIRHATIGRFARRADWDGLLERLDGLYPELDEARRYLVNLWFLQALDMIQFADVAFDLRVVLKRALKVAKEAADVHPRIRSHLVKLLRSHLEQGGSSVFIDLEFLSTEGDLAPLAPDILERRRMEFANARREFIENIPKLLPPTSARRDLSPIWVTAYGFSLLSSLGASIIEEKELWDWHQFKSVFESEDLGDIDSTESSSKSTPVSIGFRKFILLLVEQGVAFNLVTARHQEQV
jgi:hypothetical protein